MPQPELSPSNLRTIRAAVETISDKENQDPHMVVEMALEMLSDVIDGDGLKPMKSYVGRYCDVLDGGDAEASSVATYILEIA